MNTYAETVRVGVAGATGYSGVELMRLLARHPRARVTAAMGSPGSEPRRVRALTRVWDEPIEPLDVECLAGNCDAVFLALPEQASAAVAPELLARGTRVFDLSGAFRLKDRETRRQWYPHTPDAGVTAVYGLTEKYRDGLASSQFVACAGCYPTAAILSLQPLIEAGLIEQPIIIDAKSGVSGARQRARVFEQLSAEFQNREH
jgi:N-acetyl-gamma-glutamyl-phosphate reductase